jgi:hypothetical protein
MGGDFMVVDNHVVFAYDVTEWDEKMEIRSKVSTYEDIV